MDSFIYSLNSTVPIFLVMILGWLIKQWGVIDEAFINKANKYVFHVALPFLLFKDIAEADMRSGFDIRFVLYCMLVTAVCFAGIWLVSEKFIKKDEMIGSFVQGSFRSSAAILGVAFIQNMYDSSGMAPLMIVSAVPLYNIFSVIVLTFKAHPQKETGREPADRKDSLADGQLQNIRQGVKGDTRKEQIKKACLNILKNPIIIGIVLGLPFSIAGVTFPPIVEKTISSVAQTATPIALIVIGAGFEGRRAIQKLGPTVVASFIKLVGLAALFLPVAVVMGFRNQELMAILIMLASPTTVSSYIMAKSMDNDDVLASSIVVLTTLVSSVTLTGWIFLLRMLGYI